MSPQPIEEIEQLFQDASPENKINFLFLAIKGVSHKVDDLTQTCSCRINTCDRQLLERREGYFKTFVTRKQAAITGGILFLLVIAFSLGMGLLTWKEALSMVPHP